MAGSMILFGAGGHARVVADALRAGGQAEFRVAVDGPAPATDWAGEVIAEGRAWLIARRESVSAIVPAIGDNRARHDLIEWADAHGFTLATVIHPSAIVSAEAEIGAGCFLAPGAVVNAGARLGRGAIVNTAASVDHDCLIGEAAHIGPGVHLCGNVTVGKRALIGVGSAARPGVSIGADAVVGAGSAIVSDLPPGATAMGKPARVRP